MSYDQKVLFMGTPDFAEESLRKIIEEKFNIIGVFSQPDKPKGRGMELVPTPVKKLAVENGIPVYQPQSLRTEESISLVRELSPDIIVVVAYGKLIPDEILAVPQYGAINVHGSLLPAYRGAAPIQWSVLNGDKFTGVTTMYLSSEMDTGDIIYAEETAIGEYETSGELFDRLMVMGGELLVKTLTGIFNDTAPRTPQEHSKATYTRKLDKTLSPVNWNNEPRMVLKQIYGLQPWPVATTMINGREYRLFGADYTSETTAKEPGHVVSAAGDGIIISCKDGKCLKITELQAAGKKRMPAADFLKGHKILPD